MNYEIIDFHTHPFTDAASNICNHKAFFPMSSEDTVHYMKSLGISKICGSVLCFNRGDNIIYQNDWDAIVECNKRTLELKKQYGDYYIPGFHVHPGYVKESCDEIEKMYGLGVRLLGELVPYLHDWRGHSCNYSSKEFDEILDVATQYHMIVNFHSGGPEDIMDEMVRKHPDTIFVAAHPGEYSEYCRHLKRMKMSKNYYLDLSGTGLFRHGMLRRGINECGVERFLFGSDFPTCNPAMFIGGVVLDTLLTEAEKCMILAGNAKRLLGNV